MLFTQNAISSHFYNAGSLLQKAAMQYDFTGGYLTF